MAIESALTVLGDLADRRFGTRGDDGEERTDAAVGREELTLRAMTEIGPIPRSGVDHEEAVVLERFEAVRVETLARPRDPARVAEEVVAMRRRMRTELDRTDAALFDLKQGDGGLVDLEFLLQAMVLAHAGACAPLRTPRDTPGLIDAAQACGRLDATEAARLQAAHATLLTLGLECTLDRRARRVPFGDTVDAARAVVRDVARAKGLDFDAG